MSDNLDSQNQKESKVHEALEDFNLRSYQSMAIASITLAAWGFQDLCFLTVVYWIIWTLFFICFLRCAIGGFAIHKYIRVIEVRVQTTKHIDAEDESVWNCILLLMKVITQGGLRTEAKDEFNWQYMRNIHPRWYLFSISCFIVLVGIQAINRIFT